MFSKKLYCFGIISYRAFITCLKFYEKSCYIANHSKFEPGF